MTENYNERELDMKRGWISHETMNKYLLNIAIAVAIVWLGILTYFSISAWRHGSREEVKATLTLHDESLGKLWCIQNAQLGLELIEPCKKYIEEVKAAIIAAQKK